MVLCWVLYRKNDSFRNLSYEDDRVTLRAVMTNQILDAIAAAAIASVALFLRVSVQKSTHQI